MPLIVILACYLGLAYLTFDTQGFYVYGFLDPYVYPLHDAMRPADSKQGDWTRTGGRRLHWNPSGNCHSLLCGVWTDLGPQVAH